STAGMIRLALRAPPRRGSDQEPERLLERLERGRGSSQWLTVGLDVQGTVGLDPDGLRPVLEDRGPRQVLALEQLGQQRERLGLRPDVHLKVQVSVLR